LNAMKWYLIIALCLIVMMVGGCTVPTLPATLNVDKSVLSLGERTTLRCIAPHTGNATYQWWCNGGTIEGEGAVVTWVAPECAGAYLVRVRVVAEDGKLGQATTTIKVVNNHPPVIDQTIVTAQHKYLRKMGEEYKYLVGKGQEYQIECQARDQDGDTLTYEWFCSAGELRGSGPVVTWLAPDKNGDVQLTVTVSDGRKGVATRELLLTVVACSPCTFR